MTGRPHRLERLAGQMREEIADVIAGELRDPRIGLATVTRVDLSVDLRHARVLVSVVGDHETRQTTLKGLSAAAAYVRGEVGRRLRVRRVPELVFILDESAEESQKIEALIEKLKREQEPGVGGSE